MSEVEGQTMPPTQEIVPSKSEDKLEIEKEEKAEKDEKHKSAENIVDAMFSEDKKEESVSDKTEQSKESEVTEKSNETEEKSDKNEEKTEEKVEGAESKDEEKTESKDKKFNLPKIKQPKIIKEIRSRSKSRDKKKVNKYFLFLFNIYSNIICLLSSSLYLSISQSVFISER